MKKEVHDVSPGVSLRRFCILYNSASQFGELPEASRAPHSDEGFGRRPRGDKERAMRFENKVVLVTGGNVGIGRATALAFAKQGAKVVVSARREPEGIAAVKEIQAAGGAAAFVRADVALEADVQALIGQVKKLYGRLDVVFNNAGVEGKVGPIETLTAKDFDDTFAVNVRGSWLVLKYALPLLRESKGVVINNGSVVADIGMAGTSVYAATKGAIATLTRAAAIEVAKEGVRVNSVSPGPIETDMGARFFGTLDNMRGFASTSVPIGRTGQPNDIAEAVLYLASASFVTGQTLTVDGGLISQ
jgi:NAD(P)-dependent dehydrogenase (short-subunit alcohol dehydrogenase family)